MILPVSQVRLRWSLPSPSQYKTKQSDSPLILQFGELQIMIIKANYGKNKTTKCK